MCCVTTLHTSDFSLFCSPKSNEEVKSNRGVCDDFKGHIIYNLCEAVKWWRRCYRSDILSPNLSWVCHAISRLSALFSSYPFLSFKLPVFFPTEKKKQSGNLPIFFSGFFLLLYTFFGMITVSRCCSVIRVGCYYSFFFFLSSSSSRMFFLLGWLPCKDLRSWYCTIQKELSNRVMLLGYVVFLFEKKGSTPGCGTCGSLVFSLFTFRSCFTLRHSADEVVLA